MGPIVAEAAVTAAAKGRGYPSSVMALISMVPRPAASATAEPDIPAKITLPMTLTWASPPRNRPARHSQKS